MEKKVISVYGYGRFGKLWANILAKDFKVKVYTRRGLTNDEVDEGIEISSKEDIFDCDALFFCVAISSLEEVLIDSKKYFKENCLYFDTCSVKVEPANWMKKHVPSKSQIIATHPMFGPDSYLSTDDNLPMVMCNINAQVNVFEEWSNYFSTKKMDVEIMTVEEHDEMVAYSQGITHYVGRVLADLNLGPSAIDTLGYRKLLEIIEQTCNDTWQLFVDLQKYNPYTKKMRESLHESIEKIYSHLNGQK